jgi:hypothetical protein
MVPGSGSRKSIQDIGRNKTENKTVHISLCLGAQDLVTDQVVTRHRDLVSDQVKRATGGSCSGVMISDG